MVPSVSAMEECISAKRLCMMRSHHNVGASMLLCIAHMYEPPMAQFDSIAINIWKNGKVNSDVNIMCQKPLMGQFDGIIKNI